MQNHVEHVYVKIIEHFNTTILVSQGIYQKDLPTYMLKQKFTKVH